MTNKPNYSHYLQAMCGLSQHQGKQNCDLENSICIQITSLGRRSHSGSSLLFQKQNNTNSSQTGRLGTNHRLSSNEQNSTSLELNESQTSANSFFGELRSHATFATQTDGDIGRLVQDSAIVEDVADQAAKQSLVTGDRCP